MQDAGDLGARLGTQRHDVALAAHGDESILQVARVRGVLENPLQALAECGARRPHPPARLGEPRARLVIDLARRRDHLQQDARRSARAAGRGEKRRQRRQRRLGGGEGARRLLGGHEPQRQLARLQRLQAVPLPAQPLEGAPGVGEAGGQRLPLRFQAAQSLGDPLALALERLRLRLRAQGAHADAAGRRARQSRHLLQHGAQLQSLEGGVRDHDGPLAGGRAACSEAARAGVCAITRALR